MDHLHNEIESENQNENLNHSTEEILTPLDDLELDSATEATLSSKFLVFEEYKKLQSDSSLFSDYSSENSETVADSDVSSRKHFSSQLKLVSNKQ